MNQELSAHDEAAKQLIEMAKRLTLLANTIERNSATTLQAQQASLQEQQRATQVLAQTVADLRSDVNHLIEDAGHRVETSTRNGISAALGPGTAKYNQEAASITSLMSGSARTFVQTLNEVMTKVIRHLWTSFAAVAGAILLLLGGGGLLLWHETQSYNDARARTAAAQVDAETVEAYAQVGVTSCGGRACVRLDAKTPRWGSKGEYVLLESGYKPKSASAQH